MWPVMHSGNRQTTLPPWSCDQWCILGRGRPHTPLLWTEWMTRLWKQYLPHKSLLFKLSIETKQYTFSCDQCDQKLLLQLLFPIREKSSTNDGNKKNLYHNLHNLQTGCVWIRETVIDCLINCSRLIDRHCVIFPTTFVFSVQFLKGLNSERMWMFFNSLELAARANMLKFSIVMDTFQKKIKRGNLEKIYRRKFKEEI